MTHGGAAAAAGLLLITAGAGAELCPGDCDGDRITSPAELARAVRAAFDFEGAACPAADLDDTGSVTAAELLHIRSALVAPPADCGPVSTWSTCAPLPGGPRQEIGVAALAERVYVLGGLTAIGAVSQLVEVFDAAAQQWEGAADLPVPRHHVGAAALAGRVYAVGGFSDQIFTPAGEVFRYEPAANTWATVAALPTARGALAVAALDGMLYASGGSGPSGSVADHAAYDPDADRWTPLAPLPSPRNHLGAVALGAYLYVVGGRSDSGGGANTGELDRYDPTRDHWDVLTPMPTARSGSAVAVLGGRIAVLGGEVNNDNPPNRVFVEVELYDPAADRWTAIEPMAVPRHGIGAAAVDDLLYVPGGATRAGYAATDYCDALQVR